MSDRVLITGGAGFIGSRITQKLIELGYRVRIIDNLSSQIHGDLPNNLNWLKNPKIEFIRASLLDRSSLQKSLKDVDHIIHLAAETGTGQSMYEICNYVNINIMGTSVLLEEIASDHSNIKSFSLASSRSVYGEGPYVCKKCSPGKKQYPTQRMDSDLSQGRWNPRCDNCGASMTSVAVCETDKVQPASIYAETKLSQESLIKISCSRLGIDYCIFRLQNVYGEGQSLQNPYTGLLSIFSTKLRYGLDLPVFEDGEETRDFVHVEDVSDSFIAYIQCNRPVNQIINVGSGIGTSIAKASEELIKVFDSDSRIKVTGQYRLGDIRHNSADITKLESILKVKPKVDFKTGLTYFANWVNTQELPSDKLDQANKELKDRGLMK